MLRIPSLALLLLSILFACNPTSSQQSQLISPSELENRLSKLQEYQLVDVRTPEEFSEKRIANAVNMDHYDERFFEHAELLDKSKPVYIYCLSGGRSSAAVKNFEKLGFTEVYDLKGGILAWEKEGKKLERTSKTGSGMAVEELEKFLETDKLVLIDFNAKWCVPCRKMAPFLKKIEEENPDVIILPIDADKNNLLTEKYEVESLPSLFLYKNQQVVWQHKGFIDEKGLMDVINRNR